MVASFYRNVAVRPLPIGLPGFPDQPPPWALFCTTTPVPQGSFAQRAGGAAISIPITPFSERDSIQSLVCNRRFPIHDTGGRDALDALCALPPGQNFACKS